MSNDSTRKRCNGCKYCHEVESAPMGFAFLGCTHEPYKGKWAAEIEKCPKEGAKE